MIILSQGTPPVRFCLPQEINILTSALWYIPYLAPTARRVEANPQTCNVQPVQAEGQMSKPPSRHAQNGVKLDANNMMAGKRLFFELEVMTVESPVLA